MKSFDRDRIAKALLQATQLGQSGQLTAAAALCRQILRKHPNVAPAWHLLGLTALQQGQAATALAHIEKAIALDPTTADFYNHAGVVQFQLGNLDAGIACYRQALLLQPQSIDACFNLALGLQKLGNLDEAIAVYCRLIDQQPHHAQAHCQLGNIYQLQRRYASAISHYQQAVAIKPDYTEAWYNLGVAQQELQETDLAFMAYQQAIKIDPNYAEAHNALGAVSEKEMQATPAIKHYQHPIKTATASQSPLNGEIICRADEGFAAWIEQAGGSIVISTYQAGKLLLVGCHDQKISILMRQFDKPMGIAVQGDRLALATKHEVILFANARPLAYSFSEDRPGHYDALFLPRVSYLTGDLFIHDLDFGDEDLWCVNTRFSCLATLSSEYSFVPRWQPPFITELAPEDRCHLNGMAMIDGKPKYVTALGIGDTVGGWRANKATGGIVMDVDTGEVILQRLSMPHSPVWHNNYLWLLNSGTGELWRFDPDRDRYEVICSLPGYGRGLCIITCAAKDRRATGKKKEKSMRTYALVGLSQIREQHIFGGLPIQARLEHLICGVAVVDLDTGNQVGLLTFEKGCQELYGINFLKGISHPSILNQDKPEIRDAFTAPEFAYWLRPSTLTQDNREY